MPHIYGLDQNSEKLVDIAAKIAKDVATPAAQDVDAKGRFPSEAVSALGEAGLLGLTLPADVGGKAQGPRVFCAIAEELATACASTSMIFVMHTVASQAIASSSTLANKESLLREIASGKHLTTLALTEAGSRSNFWFQTSELADGGDHATYTATKRFVTSSAHVKSYVTQARRPGAQNNAELTSFLIRREGSGITVKGGFDGLGLRGNESGPVEFSGYKVASGDLLTAHGDGGAYALGVVLPWFSMGTAAMANGLSRASVAATASHLQNTAFEHDNSKLRDLPTLRARLAEMAVRTEQARAMLGHTLNQIEALFGLLGAKKDPGAQLPATQLAVLQARYAGINAAVDVTDLAMKACGGAAFSKQLGVERWFRDARAGWVMAPTSDALADFMGRALTGMELL